MACDYLTEKCETCMSWVNDRRKPVSRCVYKYPEDHCAHARKKFKESGKNIPLTPEEFAAEMKKLQANFGDEEARHGSMDELMCHVLISLGYEKGVEIFNNTPMRYA